MKTHIETSAARIAHVCRGDFEGMIKYLPDIFMANIKMDFTTTASAFESLFSQLQGVPDNLVCSVGLHPEEAECMIAYVDLFLTHTLKYVEEIKQSTGRDLRLCPNFKKEEAESFERLEELKTEFRKFL